MGKYRVATDSTFSLKNKTVSDIVAGPSQWMKV